MEPPLDSIFFQVIGFIIALLATAFFSFLETSITALRLFKLKELANETKKYTALFETLEKNPHRILATILIASNLANVTAAALSTQIMETVFARLNLSEGLGFSLGIGVTTILMLIFSEILPKNFAKLHGERLFKSLLWLTNAVFYLLYPFVTFLTALSDFVLFKISKKPRNQSGDWVSESEIRFLIDYIDENKLMEPEKTSMLQSIFRIAVKPVEKIMVPSSEIVTMGARTKVKDALAFFAKHPYTRIPVYDGDKNNIIGFVHQKDVFLLMDRNEQDQYIKDIIRPIMFVPESLKVNQLLKELRDQHMHMAIVLNEHGTVTGLATLEDAIEEIVGEIKDEYEPTDERVTVLEEGVLLVDAGIDLDELGKMLSITFESESAITMGGFLTERLQHLPKKGERILYKGYYFEVEAASPKKVNHVRIFKETTNVPTKIT